MLKLTTAFGTAALVLALVACGSGPSVGSTAPSFQTTTASGEIFDLADKRGTIVIIDFYANW